MSIALQIEVRAPDLAGWREAVEPLGVNKVLGIALQEILTAHFRNKDRTPNAKGFPRKYFWAGIARDTVFDPETDADENGATVTISGKSGRPFALRYFGGVVKPTPGKKYLAIPLTAEAAKARRPREIPDLFPIRGRNGNKFLARRAGGRLERLFLLTQSAAHTPDVTALPDEATTVATLVARAEANIRRKLSR